ncbi:MAG TPA: 3-hydroxyacyl-CoA dehydrogenase family protein [Jatrophihabitans sp.]|nr:3-hydroxyacyl-CoA dehydrogenase family protein [Jatrophihabitans sp.]
MSDPAARSRRIGVVGGGTMGSGIAHVLLVAGYDVLLVESDEAALDRAVGLVRRSLDGAVQRGKLADAAQPLSRLSSTVDRNSLSGAAIVIEAVPEILQLKIDLLADVEAFAGDDVVLASNTSSLSLARIGERLRRPERLVGMHFFNPVPAQPLLEIVRSDRTSAQALAAARELAEALGKEVVEVRDSPGFATSRLGVALGLEAVRMVEEGVAAPEDIDKAMVLGYRYPMGPLRLGDLVGHDVRLGIAKYLAAELGPRFEPPELLRTMVAEGKLGKKSGQGFYTWE